MTKRRCWYLLLACAAAGLASSCAGSGNKKPSQTTAACVVARPDPNWPQAITNPFRDGTILAVFDQRDRPPGYLGLYAIIQPNGAVRAKILWRRDRRAAGDFIVTGARVGDRRDRLVARVNDESAPQDGFIPYVPSTLMFSSVGCWDVRAEASGEVAEYRVRVVRPSGLGGEP